MPDALDASRVIDVLSKVIQECQNGLLGRVVVIPAPDSSSAGWLSHVHSDIRRYCEGTAAQVHTRPTGMDIVVPQAMATVEMTKLCIIVTGHRRGELDPSPGGWTPTGHKVLPGIDGGALSESPACDDLLAVATWVTSVDLAAANEGTREQVFGLLQHKSWLVSSLAADALNSVGYPAVPQFVVDHPPLKPPDEHRAPQGESFTEVWEARISVDEYALYEATHPGYAMQAVVIGQAIRQFCASDPNRILDVGSGPGLPTIMLAELFPKAHIDAVEPSKAAFPHLCRNVVGYRINPHNVGIADFDMTDRYPVIVSVGTSHHLDTRLFLRSLMRLADNGGLIIVTDEMISRFLLEQERTQNIIDHHMAYIDAALGNISPDDLPELERRRLAALRACRGASPDALHSLLAQVRADRIDLGKTKGPWQRVRFAVLELEALVAGIDYDVERKTYPDNFLLMARGEGLDLITHRRIYATQGSAPEDAGTHFFAFRCPFFAKT